MTKIFKGRTPLALLADGLPVQARIGLVAVAASLAVDKLKHLPEFPIARAAFELVQRWYDGERFDPDQFEEAIAPEDDGRGVDVCATEATSKDAHWAWLALESALFYVAFHAYRTLDQCPGPSVAVIRDVDALDVLDDQLREILPGFMKTVSAAAKYLERQPEASFARLKAEIDR